MEAAVVNLVEPGDSVIVGVNGVFGARLASVVERCGGTAVRLDIPWGEVIPPEAVAAALKQSAPVKAVVLVHAETSTGAWQPIEAIASLCRESNALLIVDAVTSLGGVPVEVDQWGIDVCYSATQKCLSCPPGLAPLTVSERAVSAIRNRRHPCQSWYFDLSLILDYWTEQNRTYHHTAPISMLYALRESLRLIEEEGLPTRFARHRLNSRALVEGLKALGFDPLPQPRFQLPTLVCVTIPSRIDDGSVRSQLLTRFGIEIGGGLGQLKGKVWRIGLMGESCTEANVLTFLNAVEDIGIREGWVSTPGAALQAAAQVYSGGQEL